MDNVNGIIGELITREKYHFTDPVLIAEIVRDALELAGHIKERRGHDRAKGPTFERLVHETPTKPASCDCDQCKAARRIADRVRQIPKTGVNDYMIRDNAADMRIISGDKN